MTKTLGLPQATRLIKEAIALKGADHVQTECYYVTQDHVNYFDEQSERSWNPEDGKEPKPGCIVGTALFLWDKDALLSVASFHTRNGGLISDDTVLDALAENGVKISPKALALFSRAQDHQDGRVHPQGENAPWGQAFAQAKAELGVK